MYFRMLHLQGGKTLHLFKTKGHFSLTGGFASACLNNNVGRWGAAQRFKMRKREMTHFYK